MQRCARRLHTSLARLLGREILIDLLRTDGARRLQAARAIAVGGGFLRVRYRLGKAGPGLRHVCLNCLCGELRQHLPLLHLIADIHTHFR